MKDEIWFVIPNCKGLYKVSNYGRVKRTRDLIYKVRFGIGWRIIFRRKGILKPTNYGGYLAVCLPTGPKETKRRLVHQLVLEPNKGLCPPGMQARHLDDNPFNNHIDNLEWGTPSENAKDAYRNGKNLIRRGFDSPSFKFTQLTINKIKKLYQTGKYSQAQLGKNLG